jgi:hypothetical protein
MGWYSHKSYPALNVQAVVDDKKRFMSYSIRSGCQNDKQMFNKSIFGKTAHLHIPRGGVFLADAGYKLMSHIMTPYPIYFQMPDEESNYNYLHSRSRIVVEMAFGLWKNRFQIFKRPLNWKKPEGMSRMIEATMILHN